MADKIIDFGITLYEDYYRLPIVDKSAPTDFTTAVGSAKVLADVNLIIESPNPIS